MPFCTRLLFFKFKLARRMGVEQTVPLPTGALLRLCSAMKGGGSRREG